MSQSLHALVKEVHPPTAVEHCIYCHFYNLEEKNLVVASTNLIRVFKLIPDPDVTSPNTPSKPKLECVQNIPLFGNVMSIQSVYLNGSPREAIFISFKNAKLTLAEYDPNTHDLKILSLHFFEDDDTMKRGQTFFAQVPLLRVDPDGRCAVALVYGKNVVVLPFKKDMPAEEADSNPEEHVRSPIMASYTINLQDIDDKINNIKDIQFLHGYYEPTLLILYEPIRTWSGRIAVRQDTCCIIALSLNIYQKVHPIIWSQSSMPYDCYQTLAVPKPLGGVLIFAVNSLLYLNQSVPPYGVSLSSFTEYSTSFPLKSQEDLRISLDCAQACFIAFDKLVISLQNGDIYVLTLINDGVRCVRNFNFDKAASGVLTSCMTICEDGYLFLGSRLGNSILLHYMVKNQEALNSKRASTEERPTKKSKLDIGGEWIASDVALIEDPEELEVYGSQCHKTKELFSYNFEVCDSLVNIGPCGKICMGETSYLSEEFANAEEPDIELVTTSGYGKNGALSILQRSIRPQVVTTFELPGSDMFTVVGSASETKNTDDSDNEEDNNDTNGAHGFLILSRPNSTMILQTGQEINELDHSGFCTQSPTILAANLGNDRYILQVSPLGVRLLLGAEQIQHIPLDVGSPIVWASVTDPYALLLSEEGILIQLTLKYDPTGSPRLAISKPPLSDSNASIVTMCLYKDTSGLFVTTFIQEADIRPPEKHSAFSFATKMTQEPSLNASKDAEMDEVEALLYGQQAEESIPLKPKENKEPTKKKNLFSHTLSEATYWLFLSRDNGVLEIYSFGDYKLRYFIKNFPNGNKLLVDSYQTKTVEKMEYLPTVRELLVVGLGSNKKKPVLLALVDEDIIVYEIFPFHELQIERHLKIRFKKVPHEMILRNWRESKSGSKFDMGNIDRSGRKRWLRPFENISGYSGVFVCGRYPHWLFMSTRGELRVHSMEVDKPILSFAPFHNINCPHGFLYFNGSGELRICVLPTHISYDAQWPVRKIPLRCTPHFVNYHPETKTYCVVTSTLEPCTKIVKLSGDEKEFEIIERDEKYVFPLMEKFSFQLFSPIIWEPIPNTQIELEEWEHVTCMKNVMLTSEGTRSGLKGYLALGTNYTYGEDVTSRGRIFILDIIEVVPEPGQPLTKNKIKIVYNKEQKGPVTELCQVSGFLLTAIGQKIYIWQLKDNDLIGIAFIDTQIYIQSVIAIKNLILVADLCKSVFLLRFQEESRTLSLVSKDYKQMEVYSTQFFVSNRTLGFFVTDSKQNAIIYTYHPESSPCGQMLVKKCDFYLGHHVLTMFRIKCRTSDVEMWDKECAQQADRNHIIMFGTLDGSLGLCIPLSERLYRRLNMLQNTLFTQIPHTAGLNPKAYRAVQQLPRTLNNPSKCILDGDLIWKFINLSHSEKAEIAKKSASTSEQLMEDILELTRYTSHF